MTCIVNINIFIYKFYKIIFNYYIVMRKKMTLRKKRRFSKRQYTFSKNRKKHNKSLRRKLFKGGFNTAQFAGALAVAAFLEMDKIVLIPNAAGRQARSKRYNIIINPDNTPKIINGSYLQAESKSRISIKNFDVYVGSTTSDLLIKIDGNDGVTNRLATITQTIVQPQNAGTLIQSGQSAGLLPADEAVELNESSQQNLHRANAMLTNGIVEPESSNFANVFQTVMTLLKLFFTLIIFLLSKLHQQPQRLVSIPQDIQSQALTVLPQQPQRLVSIPQDIQSQALTVFQGTPAAASASAEQINNELNGIGNYPQFRDDVDQSENPVPANEDQGFKCVTPYNRDTANTKNRVRSCNKINSPHPKFRDKSYRNLQSCVSECYIE
jgi:hypothetical protein